MIKRENTKAVEIQKSFSSSPSIPALKDSFQILSATGIERIRGYTGEGL